MNRLFSICALLTVFFCTSLSAENRGVDGEGKDEFKIAIKHLRGAGTLPVDYQVAGKWFLLSAKQGNAAAQHKISSMYYVGLGVDQNNVNAFAWSILAAENGNQEATNLLGLLDVALTREEIEEGKRLSENIKIEIK